MPKTTDEIRVKTNPKMSYYGRIVSGAKIAKPAKIGTVYKNRPDTYYIQEPDRYLTTTGAVIAPEQRPCIVTKYTNRKTTELKTRIGSGAPVHGTVAQVRSKYKISNKVTYDNNIFVDNILNNWNEFLESQDLLFFKTIQNANNYSFNIIKTLKNYETFPTLKIKIKQISNEILLKKPINLILTNENDLSHNPIKICKVF